MRLGRWQQVVLGLASVPLLLTALYYTWYWHRYPYGWSHCCDAALEMALDRYAEEHGGAYPAGEETPEASLSLLFPTYANENMLRGKTVPEAAVRRSLEKGGRLGRDTCGWHYVEGLKSTDHGLALFWDKVGLNHNGERLEKGGHIVSFVRRGSKYIPAEKWVAFREEQARLRAALGPGRVVREPAEE